MTAVVGELRRRWVLRRDRTPLRTQLLLVVVILAAITVIATSATAAAILRNYLMDRTDDQLQQSAIPLAARSPAPTSTPGPRPFRPPADYYAMVYDGEGNELLSLGTAEADLPRPDLPGMDARTVDDLSGDPFTVPATDGDGSWRVLVLEQDDSGAVAVGLPLDGLDATVTQLLVIDGVVALLALAALAGLARWLVRNRLRPLEEVEHTAEAIAAGDLSRRVPRRDPRTEVGRLFASLNTMLSQIETAFEARRTSEHEARESEQQMRRFIADASHELRTPLTSIRGFAELYRQGPGRTSDELGRMMRRIEDEATRMGRLVNDLLLLARLDQQPTLSLKPVDLIQLAVDAVLDTAPLARNHDLRINIGTPFAPLVHGDEQRLRQVIDNLIRNATAHTPAGTIVEITVGGAADGWALLEISDTGPGMTGEDAEHVFERFYRANPARTRADSVGSSGSGLGLSIVASIVAAHHGRVDLETSLGHGATFKVLLPAASPTSDPTPTRTDPGKHTGVSDASHHQTEH